MLLSVRIPNTITHRAVFVSVPTPLWCDNVENINSSANDLPKNKDTPTNTKTSSTPLATTKNRENPDSGKCPVGNVRAEVPRLPLFVFLNKLFATGPPTTVASTLSMAATSPRRLLSFFDLWIALTWRGHRGTGPDRGRKRVLLLREMSPSIRRHHKHVVVLTVWSLNWSWESKRSKRGLLLPVDSARLIWASMIVSEDGPGVLAQIEEERECCYWAKWVHPSSQTRSGTHSLIPQLELGIKTIQARFITARRFCSFDLSLDDSVWRRPRCTGPDRGRKRALLLGEMSSFIRHHHKRSGTHSLVPHLELGIETRFVTASRFGSFDLSLDDSVWRQPWCTGPDRGGKGALLLGEMIIQRRP